LKLPALSDALARNTFGFRSLAAMVIHARGRMLWSLAQTLPCRVDSDLEHYRIRARSSGCAEHAHHSQITEFTIPAGAVVLDIPPGFVRDWLAFQDPRAAGQQLLVRLSQRQCWVC
jgi:hypothetical protein